MNVSTIPFYLCTPVEEHPDSPGEKYIQVDCGLNCGQKLWARDPKDLPDRAVQCCEPCAIKITGMKPEEKIAVKEGLTGTLTPEGDGYRYHHPQFSPGVIRVLAAENGEDWEVRVYSGDDDPEPDITEFKRRDRALMRFGWMIHEIENDFVKLILKEREPEPEGPQNVFRADDAPTFYEQFKTTFNDLVDKAAKKLAAGIDKPTTVLHLLKRISKNHDGQDIAFVQSYIAGLLAYAMLLMEGNPSPTLEQAANRADSTVLNVQLFEMSPNSGMAAVAQAVVVLAERSLNPDPRTGNYL